MPILSRSWMASTFSWWWSLPSYFCANLWILLVTTSTCRSLWRSLFLTHQSALTKFLSTLFGAYPELDTICPNRFYDLFVYKKFVMKGQWEVPSYQPIDFLVFLFQLLSLFFDTGFPSKLSVERHAKVFSSISIWYLLTINSYWDVFEASVGKVNMNWFRFIKLDVPFFLTIFVFGLWLFVISL